MEETNYHYEQTIFFNMSKMVFFAITSIFMFFGTSTFFIPYTTVIPEKRITYQINVRRKILFIFNQFKTVLYVWLRFLRQQIFTRFSAFLCSVQ